MNKQQCAIMVSLHWGGEFLHSIVQWLLIIFLPFCGPNDIDHYFFNVYPLLELACTDTDVIGFLVLSNLGTIALISFIVLVFSYVTILASLRTCSSEGRHKALSSCTSHIIVVALLLLPCIFIYLWLAQTFPEDKVFALFYIIITPMFNLLVYTLRNREMKTAMRTIDHYFCDVYPLLELACSDSDVTGFLVLANSGTIVLISFVVLIFSYVTILASLRTDGIKPSPPALPTSPWWHGGLFLSCIFIYLWQAQTFPKDKVFALFYTLIASMFNPLIYTLRNRAMKTALRKGYSQSTSSGVEVMEN
ncbi:olfactory receptor 4P4-like [Tachyglossus aculeatus]|uniref:olfactory receptor 4P4-like n=1 Tax=Tachyglossus aculeatus TaxID=9261 RepID=UPI0018F2E53F|nr:olfactory receptor 4P4-like [Tachyglossus aculeatus]